MTDPLLGSIRELEARDVALAARIDELVAAENAIAALRADAAAVTTFRKRLPELRQAAAQEREGAEEEVARRTEAARFAEAELAQARDAGRADAARALATAESSLRTATARLGQARMELARLDREAAEKEERAEALVDRSRDLATRVDEPFEGDVESWGARARAKVFADRTHAEAERQQVIAEAEELGSVVVGESLAGANVRAVARRVEATLGAS